MEAKISNPGGQELTARIKESLAEKQHRFELQDPFAETTYRFQTAEAATAKADELGASRFQSRSADGEVAQISKVDGEWKRHDVKSLADIQAEIDKDSLIAIEVRAEQRAAVGQGIDPETDKQMALADAFAFRRIQDPTLQESAAVQMVNNTRTYPEYKTGLDKAIPGYPGTAEKVAVLDAAFAERTATKVAQEIALDQAALKRVATNRQRDNNQAREALGLNAIEPNIEKQQQPLDGENDEKRQAWLKKADKQQTTGQPKEVGGNKVESDEIFTASQDLKLLVPPEIEKQYLRVGDKFYHPKNTDLVAFEDKGNKLETKSNSENIADSMVRIAEARGWDEIKVSGSETFRREVWLEASSRGMHVKGYTPSEQDKAALEKRVSESEANKIEKDNKPFRAREKEAEEVKPANHNKRMAETFAKESVADAVKAHPELAGAAAAVAVMDKKAEADGLNPAQRNIVAARVRQNVVNSIERGDIPKVNVKESKEIKHEAKEEKEYSR